MFDKFQDAKNGSTEDLLKSVLNSAPNGIMTFKSIRDENGVIYDFQWLMVNSLGAEIVNMPADQLIGAHMLEKLPGNKELGLFDKYVQVVETGEAIKFDIYYPREEINRWFDISAVKLGDGFTVSFQDITKLKEAVQEAEKREEKYRRLFEESIDAIFVVNEKLDFIDANVALQELFGYAIHELQDLSLGVLFSVEKSYTEFTRELKNLRVEEFEVTLKGKLGIERICLVNMVRINGDGKSDFFLGVIHDITKRRQADRELIQAEKLSMTGKIARTIAHEVRNPLTNLSLALEQLKDEVPVEIEDAALYFNIIERNTSRIGKLITDLLNSSKPKELKLVRQSLNDQVKEAVKLVKDRIKLMNISLEQNYAQNLPDIPIDTDQLKVALLNLLINAIEAMKPDVGVLKVSTEIMNDTVTIEVKDNGKGISEEDQERLFEPFFTSKNEGTGLGLTTVQNIIHGHKGYISMSSKLGEGTSFVIKLKI